MNIPNIAIGLLAIAFSGYTFHTRQNAPESFGRLKVLHDKWGEKRGTALHIASYTLIPFGLGVTFIVAGIHGIAFLE